MSIGGRIKHARKGAGLSQAELAKLVGRSQSAVAEWETGETAPRRNIVDKIADALGVSALWLEVGGASDRGGAYEGVVEGPPGASTRSGATADALGPIYASAPAPDRTQILMMKEVIDRRAKPVKWAGVKGLYGFYAASDTMEPRIHLGELIWVHPHRQPAPGQETVFVRRDGADKVEALVKVFVGQTATKWVVKQLNPKKETDLKKSEWDCHLIVGIDLNR